MPPLHWIACALNGGYLSLPVGIGLAMSRRAGHETESYFVGSRRLPWCINGVSPEATNVAPDTPLVVTEMARDRGLQRLWWMLDGVFAIGVVLRTRAVARERLLALHDKARPGDWWARCHARSLRRTGRTCPSGARSETSQAAPPSASAPRSASATASCSGPVWPPMASPPRSPERPAFSGGSAATRRLPEYPP